MSNQPSSPFEKQFIARKDIVISELPDGIALLDPRSSKYFSLNPVGAFIWKAMQAPVTQTALVARVQDHFNVPDAACSGDVAALLAALGRNGLVEMAEIAVAG